MRNEILLRVARRRCSPRFVPPAFLDAVRVSMRAIRSAVGAVTVNPNLLTAPERIQYGGYLRREDTNVAIFGLAKAGVTTKETVRRTGGLGS